MYRLILISLVVQLVVGQLFGTNKEIINKDATEFYNDCHMLFKAGFKTPGVYKLLDGSLAPCEFDDTHGYLVFLRREDGILSFQQRMVSYVHGFGYPHGDYWYGLGKLNNLCAQNNTVLRIQFSDWKDTVVNIFYHHFYVHDSSHGYMLNVGGFYGPNGVYDALSYNNGMLFKTYDNKDNHACVDDMKGGWWYNWCSLTLPTGIHYPNGWYTKNSTYYWDGIFWDKYYGLNYSLKTFYMAITHP